MVKEEQTTQKVHRRTLERIKRVNRHLAHRGLKLRQCDLIEEAFAFVMRDEAKFIEYVCAKHAAEQSDSKSMIVDAISKPWFPY